MLSKKAQSSVEVAAIITFMLLTMIIFLIVITDRLVEQQEKKYAVMLDELGDVIEAELELAGSVEDGYNRGFYVQPVLRGRDYDIEFYNSTTMKTNYSKLVMYYLDDEQDQHIKILPKKAVGNVIKGDNVVVKSDGVAFVNWPIDPFEYAYNACYNIACEDSCEPEGENQEDIQNTCCIKFEMCCEGDLLPYSFCSP